MTYPRSSIRYVRYAVQIAFLLITLYAGWEFHQFVLHFEEPGRPFVSRPPSVDAYLPIGALMAFRRVTVQARHAHPKPCRGQHLRLCKLDLYRAGAQAE